jgi:hypothetical protein
VTLQKYFLHPCLVIYFFLTPPIKLNKWETTNSNPPGRIKLSSQSTAGVRLCCGLYQPQQTVQICWAKPFCKTSHIESVLHLCQENLDRVQSLLVCGLCNHILSLSYINCPPIETWGFFLHLLVALQG